MEVTKCGLENVPEAEFLEGYNRQGKVQIMRSRNNIALATTQ